MKGATMKVTLEKLGIMTSYSRPRASHDNPFPKAQLRTCKYRPDWLTKGFVTKACAQAWVKSCPSWYNREHLHSAIRCVSPSMRHAGQERDALASRAHAPCKCPCPKTGTLVRQNPQLATRRTGLAEPGTQHQRP